MLVDEDKANGERAGVHLLQLVLAVRGALQRRARAVSDDEAHARVGGGRASQQARQKSVAHQQSQGPQERPRGLERPGGQGGHATVLEQQRRRCVARQRAQRRRCAQPRRPGQSSASTSSSSPSPP